MHAHTHTHARTYDMPSTCCSEMNRSTIYFILQYKYTTKSIIRIVIVTVKPTKTRLYMATCRSDECISMDDMRNDK